MKKINLPKFVFLAVLDGWGISQEGPGNATILSESVNMRRLWVSYPHTELAASGEAVGLPHGEVGNTETGHLNLGAGRIVYQDLPRINMAIANGSFFKNPAFLKAINHAKTNNSNLHLMGLVGAGGVHSNIEHLFALLHLAKENNFTKVFLHLFTDGRDSSPTSAKTYISQVREMIQKEGLGVIASVMGRYWAMDRDLRWDRTEKAYLALTKGQGNLVKTPEEAIDISYGQGKTDEFIEPSIVTDTSGKPISLISDNDAVIFFNFRIDRPRQLSRAFVTQDFEKAPVEFDPYSVKYTKTHLPEGPRSKNPGFEKGKSLVNIFFVMMTEYSRSLFESGASVAFPPDVVQLPLGRVLSEAGLRQLRVSESEKERFVTFYFNGQREEPFIGEERIIVPSPSVPTYDLKPEMSAYETTKAVLSRLRTSLEYSFILMNFANPDMVGHTGSIGAAATACKAVDECIGQIVSFVDAYDGVLLITSDHGNAEEMINSHTGAVNTEHTGNPVPFIAVGRNYLGKARTLTTGILADVAPTVLNLLNVQVPTEMTGRDLLKDII